MSPIRPPCLIIFCLGLFLGAEPSNAVSLSPQVTQSSSSVEGLVQEGLRAYSAHRLDQAILKLKQAYQLAPRNEKVRLFLGLMQYEKDPASLEAQQLMESVVSRFPDNLELQLKLLDPYLQLKNESKWPPLLDHLQNSMAVDTRFAFNVLYALIRYGKLEPAKIQLDRISAHLEPRLKGLSEQELRSPEHQALMHEAGEVSFILGLIAASSNNKSEALRLFQAADRNDFPSTDSVQMQMLAEALYRMEEYQLSMQAYEVYLKRFPSDAGARMHLAMCYYSRGMFELARESYQKVLAEAPQTSNVHLYLGLTLLELKDNEEARRKFLEELKADPQSYQAMAELAYLDYLEGENEHCLEWLGRAQPLNSDWYETNMVYGRSNMASVAAIKT